MNYPTINCLIRDSYSGTCLKGIGTWPVPKLPDTRKRRETKEIMRITRKKEAHTHSISPQWQTVTTPTLNRLQLPLIKKSKGL
jgi:hypothetical protein